MLLEEAGLITLKDSNSLESTLLDIVSNPRNLRFTELEAAMLPKTLKDVDGAVINGNYAIDAGLKVTDGIIVEGSDSPYVNIVAVKSGRENERAVEALVSALKSEKVKNWILNNYPNGEVVPVF